MLVRQWKFAHFLAMLLELETRKLMQTLFLNYRLLVFSLACPLVFFASAMRNSHGAEEVSSWELRQTAKQMERSAELLKDEIKANFKGTRRYGKLLSVVAKIKSRSAAWIRKVDRDSGYRIKQRDIEKIKNLAYELGTEYDSAIEHSQLGKGRPIAGSTVLAADQISILISLTEGLQLVSYVPEGIETKFGPGHAVVPELILLPPFDPAVDVAPGRPDFDLDGTLRTESDPAIILAPAMKSVWEK